MNQCNLAIHRRQTDPVLADAILHRTTIKINKTYYTYLVALIIIVTEVERNNNKKSTQLSSYRQSSVIKTLKYNKTDIIFINNQGLSLLILFQHKCALYSLLLF